MMKFGFIQWSLWGKICVRVCSMCEYHEEVREPVCLGGHPHLFVLFEAAPFLCHFGAHARLAGPQESLISYFFTGVCACARGAEGQPWVSFLRSCPPRFLT